MSAIVHLAGPMIQFDTVQRQRCVWCGALIDERDLARMAVQVDPTASEEVQREEATRALQLRWEGFHLLLPDERHGDRFRRLLVAAARQWWPGSEPVARGGSGWDLDQRIVAEARRIAGDG